MTPSTDPKPQSPECNCQSAENIWRDPVMHVLQTAFDCAYLELLERSEVSLDDQQQATERFVVLGQVYEAITLACEEAGTLSDGQRMEYVCKHAFSQIQRLLRQRIENQQQADEKPRLALHALLPTLQEVPEQG